MTTFCIAFYQSYFSRLAWCCGACPPGPSPGRCDPEPGCSPAHRPTSGRKPARQARPTPRLTKHARTTFYLVLNKYKHMCKKNCTLHAMGIYIWQCVCYFLFTWCSLIRAEICCIPKKHRINVAYPISNRMRNPKSTLSTLRYRKSENQKLKGGNSVFSNPPRWRLKLAALIALRRSKKYFTIVLKNYHTYMLMSECPNSEL